MVYHSKINYISAESTMTVDWQQVTVLSSEDTSPETRAWSPEIFGHVAR